MTDLSKTLFADFQVRKTKKQKKIFRAWLCGELEKLGYSTAEESGNFSCNVVAGDPETAEVIFAAHYDTCPVLPIPNFITPRNPLLFFLYQILLVLPAFLLAVGGEIAVLLLWKQLLGTKCPMWLALGVMYLVMGFFLWWLFFGKANRHTANDNTSGVITLLEIAQALPAEQRDTAAFIFFDNEEKGLLGSAAFAGKHRKVKKSTLLLNFDCVSDGDFIHLFPAGKVLKEEKTAKLLREAFLPAGGKTVTVIKGLYPSDQRAFARGVGVCALKHNRCWGYYMDRIHTNKDTAMDEGNIALLRDGAVRLVGTLSK